MWHRGVMAAFQPARELQKWSRKASGFPRVEGKVSPGVSGTYGPGREPAGGCGRGGPELYSRWLLAGSPMMVCERGVNGAPRSWLHRWSCSPRNVCFNSADFITTNYPFGKSCPHHGDVRTDTERPHG